MSKEAYFSIKSKIEFQFENSQIRNISYNSFLPEFNRLQTKRSIISIEKKEPNSIIFEIKSNDITAFRASINEIISFGKIVIDSLRIVNNS
jgi:tRNA threonylcarbamoyladenosine modification (KEOPS) complex  Pcc1 subunit